MKQSVNEDFYYQCDSGEVLPQQCSVLVVSNQSEHINLQDSIIESATKVMDAYQSANKWLDILKEVAYTNLGCVFFASYIHELAHTMPERFDKFGDILHTINMKIPYPPTAYIPQEPTTIDEIFSLLFVILDSIKVSLNDFIKCTDEQYHGMACSAEELLNDIESEYPMLYRLQQEWTQCNGDNIEFDKYVNQYVTNKDNLTESLEEKEVDTAGLSKAALGLAKLSYKIVKKVNNEYKYDVTLVANIKDGPLFDALAKISCAMNTKDNGDSTHTENSVSYIKLYVRYVDDKDGISTAYPFQIDVIFNDSSKYVIDDTETREVVSSAVKVPVHYLDILLLHSFERISNSKSFMKESMSARDAYALAFKILQVKLGHIVSVMKSFNENDLLANVETVNESGITDHSSLYITSNGKVLNSTDMVDAKNVKYQTHSDLFLTPLYFILSEQVETELEKEVMNMMPFLRELERASIHLQHHVIEDFKWVKINTGTEVDKNQCYILLPPGQMSYSVLSIVKDVVWKLYEWGHKEVQVAYVASNDSPAVTYKLETPDDVEYVLDRLDLFQCTHILKENKNSVVNK